MSRHEGYPHDGNGNPMVIITAGCTDTVPTVQYGSVKLFASITRPVINGTHEELINETRKLQQDAEFCVGVEGRRLIQALNPNYKFFNPATGEPAFAAPPKDYDPSSMPPHPGDIANAKAEQETES
jgi:hypothetical protein